MTLLTNMSASQKLELRTANELVARKPVTLLVIGQSTEQGPIPITDRAAFPVAFTSVRNPGFMQKRLIPQPNRGGWWSAVYDALWDAGYDADICNAAVGGSSVEGHWIGANGTRQNSTPYYQRRQTGLNYPDLGDFGDVIRFSSQIYNVTTGRKRQAFNDGPFEGVVGTSVEQDFIGFGQTSELSGSTVPDTTGVPIGGTLTDGTLTLTRLNDGFYNGETTFYPGIDASVNGGQPNYVYQGRLGERNKGRGYDPLGLISSAYRLAQQAAPSKLKIVYFSNGQSDLGSSAAGYQYALMMLLNFFLRRGWTAVIGNTIYSPGSSGSTATNYGNQVTGVDQAVTALLAAYPGKVYRGANLYQVLGSTGQMGGMRVTASISGTVMTITATLSGSEIVAGQTVYNGTAVVGTVASLGTYNGTSGTGTVNLNAGATATASTTLISVGAGLQFDGIHQTGVVVPQGASAIATSLISAIQGSGL